MKSTAKLVAATTYIGAVDRTLEATAAAMMAVGKARWDNAHLLALEAKAMIELLRADPRVFMRNARVGHWRRRYRRFAAKAYALDHVTAWRAGLRGAAP